MPLALPALTDVNSMYAHIWLSLSFYYLYHSASLFVSRTLSLRNLLYLDFSIFMDLDEHLASTD